LDTGSRRGVPVVMHNSEALTRIGISLKAFSNGKRGAKRGIVKLESVRAFGTELMTGRAT
jgi:hypothetical protein